jgi:hypothetical protein
MQDIKQVAHNLRAEYTKARERSIPGRASIGSGCHDFRSVWRRTALDRAIFISTELPVLALNSHPHNISVIFQ